MAKIKACYIKEGHNYIEKQVSELHINGTKVLEYPDRKFYYFSNYLIEVSADEQKELFKEKNHSKYLKRKNNIETVSLDVMIADGVQGLELLADPTDYESVCVNKIIGDMAIQVMNKLPSEEHDLIINIVINKVSEREYAKKTDVHHMTIHSRKKRILMKLKKALEKNK